jgi:hypothetical protein
MEEARSVILTQGKRADQSDEALVMQTKLLKPPATCSKGARSGSAARSRMRDEREVHELMDQMKEEVL